MTDDRAASISRTDLYAVLGSAAAPVIIDVRREPPVKGEPMLAGAVWRSADAIDQWRADLPAGRGVIAYCADGADLSRAAAASLRKNGVSASYLDGGLKGWTAAKLPLRRARGAEQRASRWVTREHPKIDRNRVPLAGQPVCRSLRRISSMCRRTTSRVSRWKRVQFPTTSRMLNSDTSAIAAVLTRSSVSMAFMMWRSIISPPSCAARIRPVRT